MSEPPPTQAASLPASRGAWVHWLGLPLGPLTASVCYWALPTSYQVAADSIEFSPAGRATLAVMCWMATWWLTEALPVYATALLPLAIFPLIGIASMEASAAPYANPLIFLFMGGFLLSLAMERWGLGRRIALQILLAVGTRPVNMVAGFMLTTALFSACVSNTATAAMMLPIALSVIRLLGGAPAGAVLEAPASGGKRVPPPATARPATPADSLNANFATCLLLGIAYAASIGGLATIIGSPPNVFAVSFLRDGINAEFRAEYSFAGWMLLGVPLALAFLPIVLVLLTKVLYPIGNKTIEGGEALIRQQLNQLGPVSPGEWATLIVFLTAALLWVGRPWLQTLEFPRASGRYPLHGLSDPGIALGAALVLFAVPLRLRPAQFVLDWPTAVRLPWGILLLFGGGLSLAAAVKANGVAEFVGSQAGVVSGMPSVVVVAVVVTGMVFLTELTSNTATTATLVPVLAAMAPGLGIHPHLLVIPAAISASCAFMLPVATPPNAIIFGSGHVTIAQMARAGLALNLVAIGLVTAISMLILNWGFGISN